MTQTARVLFSISDTGGGHRSAAIAIDAALQDALGEQFSSEIVDIMQVSRFPLARNAPELYDELSTRWLPYYDAIFRLTNDTRTIDAMSMFVNRVSGHHVARTLRQVQPHLVVVTHPLTQRLVTRARQRYRLPFRIVTVVTDLVTLHASWNCTEVDQCLLPTDEAHALMRQRGMPAERMVRTGFPVHPKFMRHDLPRSEARRQLNLEDRSTILLTGGGVGSGSVQELVPALEQAHPEKQLLVVTGKNQTLYRELRAEHRSSHTHIYGFVQNMEALMAASDVVVTKAGPGTLMEALVMRRPVIVTEAVGMQEQGNIDFVVDHKLGLFCPTPQRIVEAIYNLTTPERYQDTVDNLVDAVPRDGSAQIARLLLQHLRQTGLSLVPVEAMATP